VPLSDKDRERIFEDEKARQEIREELEREREGRKRRLRKSKDKRVLAGVAGGIAEHFDLDPVLVRLGFVALCFVNLIGLIAYVVLAIVMPRPEEDERGSDTRWIVTLVVLVALFFIAIPVMLVVAGVFFRVLS
jgi:phage shock protein C